MEAGATAYPSIELVMDTVRYAEELPRGDEYHSCVHCAPPGEFWVDDLPAEDPVPALVPDLGSDDEDDASGAPTISIKFVAEDNGLPVDKIVERLTHPYLGCDGVSNPVLVPKTRLIEIIKGLKEYLRGKSRRGLKARASQPPRLRRPGLTRSMSLP